MAKAARKKKRVEPTAGFDGRQLHTVPIRLTMTRTEPRIVRSRPGDFHWRYNRDKANSALLHAGIKFADLWERAGIAAAGSPNMEGGSGSAWKGLPDGRVVALDELRSVMQALGMLASARLSRYVVDGQTTGEIARQFGMPDRDMAAVLDMDLRAAAIHLKMMPALPLGNLKVAVDLSARKG